MKKTLKISILPLLLFSLFWSTQVLAQSKTRTEIEALVKGWQQDYNNADAEGLMNFYAQNAVIALSDGTTLNGPEEARNYYSEGFKKMEAVISIQIAEVLEVDAGYTFVSGKYQIKGSMKDSGRTVAVNGNYTMLVHKENGQWKLLRGLISETPADTTK